MPLGHFSGQELRISSVKLKARILVSVDCNYNGFETFFEGVYIKTENVAFVVMTKQTGAKLARIDVSVVGEEAQIAEQQAKLLKWSNIGGNVNLISHCFQVVLSMYGRMIRYFHGQFCVSNSCTCLSSCN